MAGLGPSRQPRCPRTDVLRKTMGAAEGAVVRRRILLPALLAGARRCRRRRAAAAMSGRSVRAGRRHRGCLAQSLSASFDLQGRRARGSCAWARRWARRWRWRRGPDEGAAGHAAGASAAANLEGLSREVFGDGVSCARCRLAAGRRPWRRPRPALATADRPGVPYSSAGPSPGALRRWPAAGPGGAGRRGAPARAGGRGATSRARRPGARVHGTSASLRALYALPAPTS